MHGHAAYYGIRLGRRVSPKVRSLTLAHERYAASEIGDRYVANKPKTRLAVEIAGGFSVQHSRHAIEDSRRARLE